MFAFGLKTIIGHFSLYGLISYFGGLIFGFPIDSTSFQSSCLIFVSFAFYHKYKCSTVLCMSQDFLRIFGWSV